MFSDSVHITVNLGKINLRSQQCGISKLHKECAFQVCFYSKSQMKSVVIYSLKLDHKETHEF